MAQGVELATAYVSLVASARDLGPSVAKQFGAVEKQADGAGKRIGGKLSGGIGASLKMLGAAGAILGVKDFLGDAISEARESQKVGAITTQIIKSTGGAAKVSADQVGDLATAISNKTGVDDEAIQSGANMLLTFKKVRNEVGKGSNVFDRATQAAADLSAAGFGDMSSQSKMLGKALNDPIKGISALSRSGVTFTAQQQSQIKTLVASGKTLEAQKIILGEVESQVGGTAEASATAGEKLATTFGNFKESIGTALLPALDAVFTKASEFIGWLQTNMGPALSKVGKFFAPVVDTVKLFIGTLTGNGADVDVPWMNNVIDMAGTMADVWENTLLPAFAAVKDFIATQVVPRFLSIKDAIAAFVNVALPIVQGFVKGMMARIEPLMPTIREVFGTIGQIITGALDLIKAVIERVTSVISFIWRNWGQGIMNFIAEIMAKVIAVIRPALQTVQGIIKVFTSIFKGDWGAAWGAFVGIFKSAWRTLTAAIDLATTGLQKALGLVWGGIKSAASAAWGGIVSAISAVWDGLVGVVSAPIRRVMQFIQENLIDKINGLFRLLHVNITIGRIWSPDHGFSNSARRSGKNQAFADGGTLPGYTPGRDVHQFWSPTGGSLALSGGEPILRPEAGSVLGRGWVDGINHAARSSGKAGVAKFLGHGQAFAGGGVFEALGSAWNTLRDPVGSLKKTIGNVLGGIGDNPIAQLAAGAFRMGSSALIDKIKDLLFGAGGGAGGATSVVPGVKVLPGRRLDANTAARVAAAAKGGLGFTVINGSWSNLAASMGTHSGSGAVDLWANNWGGGVNALRAQGMLAMFRNWPGNQHIHAINPNVGGLSAQALAQVRRARGNGGIFKDGGVFSYDQGGLMPPGLSLSYNGTGKPEPVGHDLVKRGPEGPVDLSEASLLRLAQLVSRIKLQSVVTAGQFDRAMGGVR